MSQPSDLIIQQFINNEDKTLEKVYRHNYKMVRSYVMKNNGTEDEAKDVFQDAMIVTWMNLKEGKFEIRNEFSLSAYLYRIAKNKWLDKLRAKSKVQKFSEDLTADPLSGEELELAEESQRKVEYLGSLFGRLDEKCKQVLTHFYYEKKRLEEIAADMSYDVGSIRTIKYRCMQRLRKMHKENNHLMDES